MKTPDVFKIATHIVAVDRGNESEAFNRAKGFADLGLSYVAYLRLRSAGVKQPSELAALSDRQILDLPNCGRAVLAKCRSTRETAPAGSRHRP